MLERATYELINRRYREAHGAHVRFSYADALSVKRGNEARAALGYRRAGEEALFLERYLDAPVEECLAAALGRPVERASVIEIGNLAADDAFAMIALWGTAANDLGAQCEIAVATLTAPLRAMFRRIGIPLMVLAPAGIEQANEPALWGRYYEGEPMVCAGVIAEGQRAIGRFLARRQNAA